MKGLVIRAWVAHSSLAFLQVNAVSVTLGPPHSCTLSAMWDWSRAPEHDRVSDAAMRLHRCAKLPCRSLHGRTAWLPRSSLLCTRAAQAAHAPSDHCTTASTSSRLEVYVVSDLHTDFQDNMRWVEQLAAHRSSHTATPHASSSDQRLSTDTSQQQPCPRDVQSVLLVAGDVSDCLQTLE